MVSELGKGFDILITVNMPSINYEVEKFYSKGNFSIWHRKFLHKVFLRKVGKLENMSDKYWEEMEEKAASEILLNLDDEVLHNITGAWTT